ncbi:MAG: peptidase ClpP [Candidatus Tectimicrobiota bacterium]|nr:MAG: peptidase ClpP [Candidatus Tectomicrobia bacterium]
MLQHKHVLLGAGGGPLAWLAVEVLRALQRAGARVRVVLSAETEAFVPALTFQSLTSEEVIPADQPYGLLQGTAFRPLEALVRGLDALVVVPATPALLAKLATACADEPLVRAALLHRGLTVVAFPGKAPAYQHPLVQHNLRRLREAGMVLYEQAEPALPEGEEAAWSLDPAALVQEVAACLQEASALAGKVVLVTAGPTQEPIDPVRHISNRSSGKTGFAIAELAQRRGARVVLVTGPTHLEAPPGVECVRVRTALEMREAVLAHAPAAHVVIKTAAVADFRPKAVATHKVKKDEAAVVIELERNPDILAELGAQKGERILVGFAAETQDLLRHAQEKLQKKHLDFIVANDVTDPTLGFASDFNRVRILHASGQVEELPTMSKKQLAACILDRVQALLAQKARS